MISVLADFWSESKERSFNRIWATRIDLLPFNFPVFISKLSECKQVDLSASFLDVFANF